MPQCLFCKIASGDVPCDKVYEDDELLAFRDINPQAPVHVLIIPKRHVASPLDLTDADASMLGRMHLIANQLAKADGIAESGFRTVLNCGPHGGQSVAHVHLHLLGKRQMTWPPG